MLKIILHRLQHITGEFISEEQAGFRAGRSTREQIFNLRIISEKYSQYSKLQFVACYIMYSLTSIKHFIESGIKH